MEMVLMAYERFIPHAVIKRNRSLPENNGINFMEFSQYYTFRDWKVRWGIPDQVFALGQGEN